MLSVCVWAIRGVDKHGSAQARIAIISVLGRVGAFEHVNMIWSICVKSEIDSKVGTQTHNLLFISQAQLL